MNASSVLDRINTESQSNFEHSELLKLRPTVDLCKSLFKTFKTRSHHETPLF